MFKYRPAFPFAPRLASHLADAGHSWESGQAALTAQEYFEHFELEKMHHSWKTNGHLEPIFELLLRSNQAMKSQSIEQKMF